MLRTTKRGAPDDRARAWSSAAAAGWRGAPGGAPSRAVGDGNGGFRRGADRRRRRPRRGRAARGASVRTRGRMARGAGTAVGGPRRSIAPWFTVGGGAAVGDAQELLEEISKIDIQPPAPSASPLGRRRARVAARRPAPDSYSARAAMSDNVPSASNSRSARSAQPAPAALGARRVELRRDLSECRPARWLLDERCRHRSRRRTRRARRSGQGRVLFVAFWVPSIEHHRWWLDGASRHGNHR